MSSLILRTATRLLITLMFVFSIFLMLRGHNEPGGGFVGGLFAASAFALHAIAFSAGESRRMLKVDPRLLIGWGLIFGVGSGVLSLFAGQPYMTGQWLFFHMGHAEIHLGSPLLFDIGVYLVVVGTVLTIILALEEED